MLTVHQYRPATSAMVHTEIGQRPNRPCPQAWAMPQSAVAGTNPKLNRKGTGRTGRQISYKIARARYDESATAAMKRIFITARRSGPTTPRIPAWVVPQLGSAVINPKLHRKDFRRFRSKISYTIHRGSYDTTAKTAEKLEPATARQFGTVVSQAAQIAPQLAYNPSRIMRSTP